MKLNNFYVKHLRRLVLVLVVFGMVEAVSHPVHAATTGPFDTETGQNVLPQEPMGGVSPKNCDIRSFKDYDSTKITMSDIAPKCQNDDYDDLFCKDQEGVIDSLRARVEYYYTVENQCVGGYTFFAYKDKTLQDNSDKKEISLKSPITVPDLKVGAGLFLHGYGDLDGDGILGKDTNKDGVADDFKPLNIVIDATLLKTGECAFIVKGGVKNSAMIWGLTIRVKQGEKAICDEKGTNLLPNENTFRDIVVVEGTQVTPSGDTDGDGVLDSKDNCPTVPNATNTPQIKENDDWFTKFLKAASCALFGCTFQADTDVDGQGDACDTDDDGDGILDWQPGSIEQAGDTLDNCPQDANTDQKDSDGDDVGDVCDDGDGDGAMADKDNCPNVANPDQADLDKDGKGDLCDDDLDGDGILNNGEDKCPQEGGPKIAQGCPDHDQDGIPNTVDNCPDVKGTWENQGCLPPDLCTGKKENALCSKLVDSSKEKSLNPACAKDQDIDDDKLGNDCDEDIDGDGISNTTEQNIGTNPLTPDTDGDGLCDRGGSSNVKGVVCNEKDPCPLDPKNKCNETPAVGDKDGDGIVDSKDNCPAAANFDQIDTDKDGKGDVCDTDDDGDGVDDKNPDGTPKDNCPLVANPGQADKDGDKVGDDCDNCPDAANPDQNPDACKVVPPDGDGDGVKDTEDNCPNNANADQADEDGDKVGDACDACLGKKGYLNANPTKNGCPKLACNLNWAPNSTPNGGSGIWLYWSTNDAETVSLTGNVNGIDFPIDTNSNEPTSLPAKDPTSYTLKATDSLGNECIDQKLVPANPKPAELSCDEFNPSLDADGKTYHLSWKTQNAETVVVNGQTVDKSQNDSGTVDVQPAGKTSYKLSAFSQNGNKCEINIQVAPDAPIVPTPSCSLKDEPVPNQPGSFNLKWTSSNNKDPVDITLYEGDPPQKTTPLQEASGSLVVTPLVLTKYTIFVQGPGGSCSYQDVPLLATLIDSDGDGLTDAADNCPTVSNKDQLDTDKDGKGDLCDDDDDGDGVPDLNPTDGSPLDNCLLVANVAQTDTDGNGVGDACQDSDQDGVTDDKDTCTATLVDTKVDAKGCPVPLVDPAVQCVDPLTGEVKQKIGKDEDQNGLDAACDAKDTPTVIGGIKDADSDGLSDDAEGKLGTDPTKSDTDGDGVGDPFDCAPIDPLRSSGSNCFTETKTVVVVGNVDFDKDGICNSLEQAAIEGACTTGPGGKMDNCDLVSNPGQEDADGDGVGDACEAGVPTIKDADGDGVPDDLERLFGTDPNKADTDGDGCNDYQETATNKLFPIQSPIDPDSDNDGVCDCSGTVEGVCAPVTPGQGDNCPIVSNGPQTANIAPESIQQDSDGDGMGNACQDDTDGDGVTNDQDNCTIIANPAQTDADEDGIGDLCDAIPGANVTPPEPSGSPPTPDESEDVTGAAASGGCACQLDGNGGRPADAIPFLLMMVPATIFWGIRKKPRLTD